MRKKRKAVRVSEDFDSVVQEIQQELKLAGINLSKADVYDIFGLMLKKQRPVINIYVLPKKRGRKKNTFFPLFE